MIIELCFRFEKGTLHGFSKLFDRNQTLLAVGWYENGRLSGLHWQFLVGGGCLVLYIILLENLSPVFIKENHF